MKPQAKRSADATRHAGEEPPPSTSSQPLAATEADLSRRLDVRLSKVLDGFSRSGMERTAILARFVERFSGEHEVDPRKVWGRFYLEEMEPMSAVFAGASIPFGTYEVVDYLAASCECVGEGMERLSRYFRLIHSEADMTISIVDGDGLVSFVDPTQRPDSFHEEYTSGIIVARFRDGIGGPFPLVSASFVRPRPPAAVVQRVEGFFGCRVEFDAECCVLRFAQQTWRAPLVRRNSELREVLERHAANLVQSLAEQTTYGDRVKVEIARAFAHGDVRISVVAKQLSSTARTVQRRLRAEQTSFQAMVEQTREALALRYLEEQRLSVTEVAFLLGYADASAFGRAFKRWRGVSPQVFRSRPSVPAQVRAGADGAGGAI